MRTSPRKWSARNPHVKIRARLAVLRNPSEKDVARSSPAFAVQISTRPAAQRIAWLSVDCDQDNDRSANSDQDVSDLLIVQGAGGEVLLCLVGP